MDGYLYTPEKPKDEDVTFVFQGAFDPLITPKCINETKRFFPSASFYLSTWEGTEIQNLVDCKIIFNRDPGGKRDCRNNLFNNLSRQLVSTQRGLEEVETKYVVKLRSDTLLNSRALFDIFLEYPKRKKELMVFERKLVLSSYFTKRCLISSDGNWVMPTPFHFSDWFCFGLTNDVLNYFNVPIPTDLYFHYFSQNKYLGNKTDLMYCEHQYAPEQYIAYNSYSKLVPNATPFENYLDFGNENILESDRYLANNFIVCDPKKLGLVCLKPGTNNDTYRDCTTGKKQLPYITWAAIVRPYVFDLLYQKYIDPTYKVPINKRLKEITEQILIAKGKRCPIL